MQSPHDACSLQICPSLDNPAEVEIRLFTSSSLCANDGSQINIIVIDVTVKKHVNDEKIEDVLCIVKYIFQFLFLESGCFGMKTYSVIMNRW